MPPYCLSFLLSPFIYIIIVSPLNLSHLTQTT
nr:MAG TPA: hypothetical protein [Caudoviricetes sp.]